MPRGASPWWLAAADAAAASWLAVRTPRNSAASDALQCRPSSSICFTCTAQGCQRSKLLFFVLT
jgi:hypothetical protein